MGDDENCKLPRGRCWQLSPLEVWEQLKIRTEYCEEILIHQYGLNEEAALW